MHLIKHNFRKYADLLEMDKHDSPHYKVDNEKNIEHPGESKEEDVLKSVVELVKVNIDMKFIPYFGRSNRQ